MDGRPENGPEMAEKAGEMTKKQKTGEIRK